MLQKLNVATACSQCLLKRFKVKHQTHLLAWAFTLGSTTWLHKRQNSILQSAISHIQHCIPVQLYTFGNTSSAQLLHVACGPSFTYAARLNSSDGNSGACAPCLVWTLQGMVRRACICTLPYLPVLHHSNECPM